MRTIGLDVHRSFAQVAILEDGKIRDAGRVDLDHSRLVRFAEQLRPDDEIVVEATGNTHAIVRVLSPFVGRVVIANPLPVRSSPSAQRYVNRVNRQTLTSLVPLGDLRGLDARRRIGRIAAGGGRDGLRVVSVRGSDGAG